MDNRVLTGVIAGMFSIIIVVLKYYLSNSNNCCEKCSNLDIKLISHPLFSRIDFLLSQVDYSLEFPDSGRALIIHDVIEKYFLSVKDELCNFAEKIEELESEGKDYNVHDLHMIYFNRIQDSYTDISNYDRIADDKESRKTLKRFLNKFQVWYDRRAVVIIKRSAEISNSNFYAEDKVKVAALFDLYIGSLGDTLHDGRESLMELNGDLSGREYRNNSLH